jgi:hypothetical protein
MPVALNAVGKGFQACIFDKKRMAPRNLILLIFLIPLTAKCQGQVFSLDLLFGGSQSTMRNRVLSGESPNYGMYVGVGTQIRPKKFNNVSFGVNLLHSQKGYRQQITYSHDFIFSYTALQLVTYYPIHKSITGYGGIELANLVSVNVEEGLSTYKRTDFGPVAGIRFFDSGRVSLNAQFVYGLVPVLHYYEFDRFGNFTREFKDLKNTCISVGIVYKIIK